MHVRSGLQRKKALPVMCPEGRWPPGHMTAMPPRSPRFWTQPAYAKVLLSAAAVHVGSEGAPKRLCELLLLRNQDVVRRGLVPEDHDPLNDERLIVSARRLARSNRESV